MRVLYVVLCIALTAAVMAGLRWFLVTRSTDMLTGIAIGTMGTLVLYYAAERVSGGRKREPPSS